MDTARTQALGMHLVLILVTGLLASQLLVANQTPSTPAPVAAGESTSPWGGDYFPNTLLTDQDGRQVHFFDDLIKGKVVAINFIFTAFSDSCPLETARLRQVHPSWFGRPEPWPEFTNMYLQYKERHGPR